MRVGGGSSDCVVEQKHFMCSRNIFQQQFLDFGIIHLANPFVVLEIVFLGWDVGEGGEGIVVKGEFVFLAAEIVNLDFMVDAAEVSLGFSFWLGFYVVEGLAAVLWGVVEGEGGSYGAARDWKTLVINIFGFWD